MSEEAGEREVVPILDGIEVGFDGERELIDWCITKIRKHLRTHGEVTSIALVLIGPKAAQAHSWAIDGALRVVTCGTAAAMLIKRAVEEG